MAEQTVPPNAPTGSRSTTLIRADQIEGLADLIRDQVRAVIHESKPVLQDVEEIRRSPAGTVIRLEEQVKALDAKVDQRFDALKSEMDQRFSDLKDSMDQQFSTVKRILVLIFPILIAVIGKLLLMK